MIAPPAPTGLDWPALYASATPAATVRWPQLAAALVGAMTLLRTAGAASAELTDTEGYYVSWSRFPDWSYYDHPPMVAWMAWLTTRLGETALAARITPVLCSAATSALLYVLADRLFGARAALFAVVLQVAIPAYFFTALLVNPEATFAPCWLLALLAIDDLRARHEPVRPLLVGAAIGLAFLSKYTAVLLVPIALGAIALTPSARSWLRRPSLYVGGAVALAVATPVVVWNASRGWPSLQLHLAERVAPPSLGLMAEHAMRAALGQLVLYHPLIVPALLGTMGVMLVRARRDERYRFLAIASFPVLVFFAFVMSRVRDAEPHWTMVGFLPVLVAAGALGDEAIERAPRFFRAYGAALGASIAIMVAATFVHADTDWFERALPTAIYDDQRDGMHETLGWRALRDAVTRERDRLGPRAVVASAHNVFCGHLLVELADSPSVYCPSPRRTQLDFEGRRMPPDDAPVIFVHASRDEETVTEALPDRRCTEVEGVSVERAGREAARYDVYACPAQTIAAR